MWPDSAFSILKPAETNPVTKNQSLQRGGERIRVVDDPLTGLERLISDVSQERGVVLVQLLGQDTRVNLSHHQLLAANRR